MTREEIVAKILKVEALYRGTDIHGEKIAALTAIQRLQAQLAAQPEPELEYQFSLPDPWKRRLFLALARRHNLKPYRKPRQRYATVMLKVQTRYLDQILWPEFLELSDILSKYLEEATDDIIARAIHKDISEAAENPNLPMQ